ncbi:Phosphate regulon transcriptional regulatory protein PhoB (SphR) [Minicystis rosea]|nr:Phosphate regulon transcriptional regulatory protein PhoB (SphR) [Minicystis rosea]
MSLSDAPLRILLVEDDRRLAELTAAYLEQNGASVVHVVDGEAGLREGRRGGFDIVVLDLMLPRLDGFDVCRALRETSDVPVVALTARTEEADRVLGLEIGADDYVTKPFSARELLARIRSVVRRARGLVRPRSRSICVGRLSLQTGNRRALLDGRELSLTGYEFTLLTVLADRAGQVLSREQLLDLAKGNAEESFDRSIDVRISRLRQKLGDDPKHPRMLKTVRGLGYVLCTGDE